MFLINQKGKYEKAFQMFRIARNYAPLDAEIGKKLNFVYHKLKTNQSIQKK